MYYEFEPGFNEYFKSTKLSSTEGILSELKSTKTKLSIYRFLYFATVTLFFISIVLALLITIFYTKSNLIYACVAGICIFGLLIMPTTSMTEKAYLYCNTLIRMLYKESNTSYGYEIYFDFWGTKELHLSKEGTIEVVQSKKQTKKQVGLMEELTDLREEGERIFNYLKTEMDKDKDINVPDSLRECLKHIVVDYAFYIGTMRFLLEDLIKMKAYSFTVEEPVDKQILKKYFREDFGKVYSFELPERVLFDKRRILLIFLDENYCFKKCLYGEIE